MVRRLLRITIMIGVIAITASLTGCGSSTKVEANTVSTGQALADLEKAHEDGLLTDSEYKKQREKILKGK